MPKAGSKGKDWWKQHEKLALVVERALRPLQEVHANTKVRDLASVLRQLDVAVVDKDTKLVTGLVEVQKRLTKVGIHDYGGFVQKRERLPAKTLVILSEAGFTAPVLKHARKFDAETVRLARIFELEDGTVSLAGFRTMVTGTTEVANRYNIMGTFCQWADDEMSVPFIDANAPFFDADSGRQVSIMDILTGPGVPSTQGINNLCMHFDGELSRDGKRLRRLMVCYEFLTIMTERETRFFAYDEVFPSVGRQGVFMLSRLNVGGNLLELSIAFTLVGNEDVKIYGQLTPAE